MGGETYENFASVDDYRTVDEAFQAQVQHAAWAYGHAGYTGTIAEKPGWVMRNNGNPIPENEVKDFVYNKDIDDNDKWGPSYCVPVCKSREDQTIIGWLFYGWASS